MFSTNLKKFFLLALSCSYLGLFHFRATAQVAQNLDEIIILTGGTSGVYYPLGVVLGKIFGDNLPTSKISVLSTKASVENLLMMQAGKGTLAFATADTISLAWNGNQAAGFSEKLSRLRGVAVLYPNYIHIVARADSNINSIADLKGKRVSVGARESATEVNARTVFAAANLTYNDFARVEYLPFGNSVKMMVDNQIDATIQSVGLGGTSIKDLSAAIPIKIIPIPPELIYKINDPAYLPAIIPAKTYDQQSQDIQTIAITNLIITRSDLTVGQGYLLTKLIFENFNELKRSHPAMGQVEISKLTMGMPIPFHPGALRYFQEKGISIPQK